MSKSSLCLLLLFVSLFVPVEALAQRGNNRIEWPTLVIKDTLHQLPADIKSVAPFEFDSWLSIKHDENREQLYLQTFYFLGLANPNSSICFRDLAVGKRFFEFPQVRKRRKQTKSDFDKIRLFTRKSDHWSPRRGRYEIDAKYAKRIRRPIENFKWVFDELESAQEFRDRCHFHRRYGHYEHFSSSIDKIQFLTEVLYAIEPPKGMSRFRICKIQLGLAGDLGPDLGVRFFHLEKFALEHMLTKALLECQSEEEIDNAIEFLQQHIARTDKTDTTLEKAKWHFIANAKVLLEVRDKDYLKQKHLSGLGTTEADLISYSLSDGGLHTTFGPPKYSADSIEARIDAKYDDIVQYSDDEKSKLEEAAGKLREAAREKDYRITKRTLAPLFIKMTKADFAKELQFQVNRYRNFEAACGKNAAERSADLEKLKDLWSLDSAWTDSPVLNYIPCDRFQDIEPELRFLRRAGLCLAVIAKWRLSHDGDLPSDLEEAFESANAGPIPRDPYDVTKPLEMKNSRVAAYIHSSGLKGRDRPTLTIEFDH